MCKALAQKLQVEENLKMQDRAEGSKSKKKQASSTTILKHNKSCMELLFSYKDAFKTTYEMLAAVETFGCSTATCESTFSTLTAINRPQRLSMQHRRMANLVFLAFERKRTEDININKVLLRFHNKKYRKLQLF